MTVEARGAVTTERKAVWMRWRSAFSKMDNTQCTHTQAEVWMGGATGAVLAGAALGAVVEACIAVVEEESAEAAEEDEEDGRAWLTAGENGELGRPNGREKRPGSTGGGSVERLENEMLRLGWWLVLPLPLLPLLVVLVGGVGALKAGRGGDGFME